MSSQNEDRAAVDAAAQAGAALGVRCRAQTPAQTGEDWRAAGAREILRAADVAGVAAFLDAYACARGSLRAARVHAEDAIARAPEVLEAALLAGAVEGLVAEVVENVRLPVRPDGFPNEKDPDVRRALANARTLASMARNLASRAARLHDADGADREAASSFALSMACDAVLGSWLGLSRLVVVEENYARLEAELYRVAARRKPAVVAQIATRLLGDRNDGRRDDLTVTAERVLDRPTGSSTAERPR